VLVRRAYLKILSDTVPDVNTLEVRIVTVIESASVSFKLIRELDNS
jgi:hypothetical protein